MKTVFNNIKIQLSKLVLGILLVCMGMMIPQDVQAVEFLYTDDGVWKFVVEDGTATICNYSHPQGESWDVIIPKKVTSGGMTYTVAKMNAYVFKNLALTSVVIPNTVKYISQETFHNCNAMTSVTFEEGSQLETIGDTAFGSCRSLTRIEIPASVVTLGKDVFNACDLLTSVTFEEGSKLESIGTGAFSDRAITQIKLPSGLKTIGSSAFHRTALTSIEIPASVTSIGDSAFEASASLTSITFAQGSSCKTIGDHAFYGVPITSIEIPASVETIEAQAFDHCQALVSITFGEGSKLTTIGEMAFYYATALTEVTLPASVTTLEAGAFENCTGLETFTIPKDSRLETIGDDVFSGVTKVKEIYFPPTLKTIGTNAFLFSHVEQFELPSGLTTIGEYAFAGNDEDVIVIPPSVTTIGAKAFSSSTNLDVFYYPEELADQVTGAVSAKGSKVWAYGEYSVSDTNPPVVTITYTGTVPSDVEVPAVIPGIEDAQIQVGSVTAPPTVFSTGCGTKLLSELSGQLPTGYSFKEPSTELVAGEDKVCQVSCTSNGQTYTFNTTIKVAAHKENKTVLVTKETDVSPACTTDGAGHTECEVCQAIVKENIAVPATGHLHTSLINFKSATCQGAGYTGDTKCTDCGQTIQKGSSIPMIPHTWDAGVVTKQATYAEQGIKTYTCTACKLQRTEPVAKKKAGAKVTDSKTKAVYKVKSVTASGGTVTYVKSTNKKAKEIKIPATVKIDGIVFKVTAIEKNAFKKHKYLKKVTIGSNVKTIGANAFYNCTKLKTVSLGKNVTTIGDKAFYKCTALTKITIASKVKKIGKAAFYGCKKLKSVTIKTTKLTSSKVGSKAFKGIKSTATVKVPKKKYSAYKKFLKKKGVSAKAKYKKF